MKVLVYPGVMEIGGSQINAIELAQDAAGRGHEVMLFGPDGALVPMVREAGLEYVRAPREHTWPSPRNMAALVDLVRGRRIDVVHAYEWGPSLDVAFGPHRRLGTPMVTTVLSMSVPALVPEHEPLVVGTPQLFDEQRLIRDRVHLIEPPIDTVRNAPGVAGPSIREQLGIDAGDLVVGVVSRLAVQYGKLDGILVAIDVVGRLAARWPVRLVVVGEGPGLAVVADRAAAVNSEHGRDVVIVTGGLLDPRPAYDTADVVIGMGSSALKGMAFGKPLVVQGEEGFWQALTEESLPMFAGQGWFGRSGAGAEDFERALAPLLADPSLRAACGALGRRIVEEHYSLAAAGEAQVAVYEDAIARRPSLARASSALRHSSIEVAKFKAAMARDRAGLRIRATMASSAKVAR